MNGKASGERHIEQLLGRAPPRTPPPEAVRRAARERLHREWREQVGGRRRRRAIRWALAASVVVAAGVVLWRTPEGIQNPLAAPGAQITQVSGEVRVDGIAAPALAAGDTWQPGQSLETGADARLALRGPSGEHLRLDQRSRVEWTSEDRLRLLAGRLYVDTAGHADALTVLAGGAQVRHLGTQYLVALDGEQVELAVRSGQAMLQAGGEDTVAGRGEALRLDPVGTVHRQPVSPWGEPWDWVDALAPSFDLDGRSAQAFLTWVAHETGREVRFETEQARAVASRATLRGDVTAPPAQALHAVLAASDLQARVEEGVIVVSLRPAR